MPDSAEQEQVRFAPYAQLVRMLLPSAGTLSLYDADAALIWCSDGYERPDLRELVDRAGSAAADTPPAAGRVIRTQDGLAAYLTELRDAAGARLATFVVELGGAAAGAGRDTVAPSLLRPVVDCLEARFRIESERVPDGAARDERTLLLGGESSAGTEAITELLDNALEIMAVEAAAVVSPDAALERMAHAARLPAADAAALLDRTRRNLLAFAELNDRPMLVNRIRDGMPAASHKILSCPVRGGGQRVRGCVVLYRGTDAPDFDERDSRVLEYVARRIVKLLDTAQDELTGLLSRQAFEQRLARSLGADTAPCALLYIDIDRLHQINEAFGFAGGDRVIRYVVDRIMPELGAQQIVGRLGGDRLAVALPGAGADAARSAGQRLIAAVSEADFHYGDAVVPVSISVGVADAGQAERSAAHLIGAAELACKRAKQRGPGQLAVTRRHAAADMEKTRDALAYAGLRDALANHDLCLEAQPLFGLARDPGLLLGFEMLVRLRGPDGTWLSPNRFLHAAEHYGLLPAIDRWVVNATLTMLGSLSASLPPLPLGVSVNVSPQSLTGGDFPRFVLDALSHAGLPSGLIGFEVKESAAARHLADFDRFARSLTAAGCPVALDNCGTSSGSLAWLKSLPIRQIKIDGYLTRRSLEDRDSAAIVRDLVRAARSFGYVVVAEHVESQALADALESVGVDFAQGHHCGPPAPLGDWLARQGGSDLRVNAHARR